jgi:CheY-like chemotaxis protein
MAATQKRVLIVDDALDIARLLRSALGAAEPNLVIHVFPSAEEAIFASARETVHLLISDLRLPGISGGELVRRIRASNPAVKVILISGLNQELINAHMGDVQVDGFIHKPFEVDAFVEMAQRCLSELDQHEDQQLLPSPEPVRAHTELEVRLLELQAGVNASAAWLFDSSGKFLLGSGDVPSPEKALEWSQALMDALGDLEGVTALLGSDPHQRVLTLRGAAQDVMVAALNHHIVALFWQKSTSLLRLALAYEEVLRLLPDLDGALQPQPVHEASVGQLVRPVTSSASPEEGEQPFQSVAEPVLDLEEELDLVPGGDELAELVSLLDVQPDPGTGADIDAFWDSLVETASNAAPAQTLSYEEALRLGLTPDENE